MHAFLTSQTQVFFFPYWKVTTIIIKACEFVRVGKKVKYYKLV